MYLEFMNELLLKIDMLLGAHILYIEFVKWKNQIVIFS